MSIAEQIKDKLNIVEYIGSSVSDLKKSGRYYKACCPFHGEKTPSFVVNEDTQSWRCFGACAEGGDIFSFAMKRNGWTFQETITELGKLAGVDTNTERTPEKRSEDAYNQRLLGLLKDTADFYHQHLISSEPDAQSVMQYALEQRGFSAETIVKFQLGYAPDSWDAMLNVLTKLGYSQEDVLAAGLASKNDSGRVYDRFRNRFMIPIRNEKGQVVGFGARALNPNDNPKYLNSPQSSVFDKSKLLFGLDMAKNTIRATGTVVVVEGYMDAIQAHQAGYTNVVAQMGTALTETQLSLIVPRYAQKLILALDADEAGQNAMRRSLEVARQTLETDMQGRLSVDIRILHMDNAKDPDDVLRETPYLWQDYVNKALPIADFVIEQEIKSLPANASIQEKQKLAIEILPLLLMSENKALNSENAQKLALRLRLNETDVIRWANEIQKEIEKERKNAKKKNTQPNQANGHITTNNRVTSPSQPNGNGSSSTSSSDIDPYANAPLPTDLYASAYSSDIDPYADVPLPSDPYTSSYSSDVDPYADAPLPSDIYRNQSSITKQSSAVSPSNQNIAVNMPPKATTFSFASRHVSRAAEAFCLSQLIKNFDIYYQVNREFRKALSGSSSFKDHSMQKLMADDFSETEYRMLFQLLLEAIHQEDTNPHKYLLDNLDENLKVIWENLQINSFEEVSRFTNGKMSAEMLVIFKALERQPLSEKEYSVEIYRQMFHLRKLRLNRELQELRFLMNSDKAEPSFVRMLSQTMTARFLFDQGMKHIVLG
jgi:DNA primase catalytic core